MKKKDKIYFVIFLAVLALIILFQFPKIPQDPTYHEFVNDNKILGIPNFWNTITNLPFLIISIFGLFFISKAKIKTKFEKRLWYLFFITTLLVSIGSSYYHLNPTTTTLFWDRLALSLIFMSLASIIIAERINVKAGYYVSPFLLILGAISVILWRVSELNNMGDLRLYGFIQFFTLLFIVLSIFLFNSNYTKSKDYLIVIGAYLVAKGFELSDQIVFSYFGFGGHPIKHVFAAFALYWLVRMITKRKISYSKF